MLALKHLTAMNMSAAQENSTRLIGTGAVVEVENAGIDRDENLAKIEVATLAIIFLVTVLGNGTVLLALWTRRRYAGRKKLSRMYFFILHLSVADLITAFLSVLPQLGWEVTYRFNGGFLMCKFVKYGQTLGPYLSSYVLMATAIDRHQAICYPLTYCSWTSRKSKVMVWLAWGMSLVFCIPQIIIFNYQEISPGVCDCWATFQEPWGEKAYVTWYGISVFIIPLLVLIVTYTSICREIWKSSTSEFGGSRYRNHGHYHQQHQHLYGSPTRDGADMPKIAPPRRAPLISRAKINTVKQTIAVIVMYIVCSMPFISAQLWATWDPKSYENPFFDGPAFTILTLLYSLNSCVNPWIYLAFNRELPRLLLRHYTVSTKQYRSTTTGNSTSNSSGGVESTSLRPLTRWSLCNSTTRSSKCPSTSSRPLQRHYGAQYNNRRWVVTTAT